jgi:hypothetical protein
MPDNKNGEIGRRIVGPLMMQGLAAMAAGAGNFHEFGKQRTPAAARAFSA